MHYGNLRFNNNKKKSKKYKNNKKITLGDELHIE